MRLLVCIQYDQESNDEEFDHSNEALVLIENQKIDSHPFVFSQFQQKRLYGSLHILRSRVLVRPL